MREPAIPSTPNDLYDHLRSSDNPAEAAANLFEGIGFDEDVRLRFLFRALKDEGLIKVFWAGNRSYRVVAYDEMATAPTGTTVVNHYDDHSVTIGAGAHVKNSSIGSSIAQTNGGDKKGFYEKHPVACTVVLSLLVGLVLMFSFWKDAIAFLEGLF